MATWLEPVFDRTLADVDFAIAKIKEWRDSGATDVYELKGCFNVSDINRIEGNIQYLTEELRKLYYFSKTYPTTWNVSGLPDEVAIIGIFQDVERLINAYFITTEAPSIPTTLQTYEQVNDLEKILYLIKNEMDNMVASYRECGTFNCGED